MPGEKGDGIGPTSGSIANAPTPLERLYEEEPQLGHSPLDLDARLTRAIRMAIAGVESLS